MLRWERVYCNLLSQQIAAQMKSLCGNQKNMYRKKNNRRTKYKKARTRTSMEQTKESAYKTKISNIYCTFLCAVIWSPVVNFRLFDVRCPLPFFNLSVSRSTLGSSYFFLFFCLAHFFVVNFPLILTDNFLLKSKLSRFPSHSIRRFRPSSCACVRVFVPWLQRLTLHFVNIPCGSVAPWL